MIKTVFNKLSLALYFIVSALIVEVITFYLLDFGFMPEYFWYNLAIISIISLLIYAIPNYTAQYITYLVVILIQIILTYVNYSLLVIYGDLFSIDMLMLGGEAMAAITTNFIYFAVIGQLVAVFLAIAIIGYFILKSANRDKVKVKQHFTIYNIVIILVVQLFSIGCCVDSRNNINSSASNDPMAFVHSDAFLMNTAYIKENSYQKFGTYGYFTNLIMSNTNNYNSAHKSKTIEYFNSGNIYDGTYNVNGEQISNGMFGRANGQNVVVIMMESLEWFAFGDGKYDYSLENLSDELTPNIYNLIHSDSSMISSNFYSKSKTNYSEAFAVLGLYPVGQSLSDVLGFGYDNDTNAFGYSMPSVMRDEGYTTSYIHSNELGFYRRRNTHKYLGFDNVLGKDTVKDGNGNKVYKGSDLWWDHWDAEGDFARNAMYTLVPENYKEKNFYSFYLNVSSHGPYVYDKNDGDCLRYRDYVMYGEDDCEWNSEKSIWELKDTSSCTYDKKNKIWRKNNNSDLTYTEWYQNIVDKFGESDPVLCNEMIFYQCGVMGLDEAIGAIIKQLKDYKYDDGTSVYDNTTLLLYSDHYAYYNGLTNRYKGFDSSDVTSVELNTVPMIIHSSAIKEYADEYYPNRAKEYLINDRFSSAYDIIPTLLDILGIKYNENLYLGHSLFRPADSYYTIGEENRDMTVYYSNTGGIYSEHMYSYNLRDFYTTSDELGADTQDIFMNEVSKVLVKLNYLGILNNYHLYNQLTNV
ncbi:MAG: LTA synthase family protein [Clostridia bacterium]